MAVYRNTRFTKRNYETSNIVAAVADKTPSSDGVWEQADESLLKGLTPLWIERGVRFYGYL